MAHINNSPDKEDDVFCTYHPQHSIIYICTKCSNNEPACRKCITSVHKGHEFMDIEDITDENKEKIVSNYYNSMVPQLGSILKNIKGLDKVYDKPNKTLKKDQNGCYQYLSISFFVYENGDIISPNYNYLAINYGCDLPPIIPANINSLLLPDGFDYPLDTLPNHIKTLFLFDVKRINSFPNSINTI